MRDCMTCNKCRSSLCLRLQLKNDHIKLKASAPQRVGKSIWVVVFTFKLCVPCRLQRCRFDVCAAALSLTPLFRACIRYLMTVRIQEEYTLNDEGLILCLKRTMANAAQFKAIKA